MKDEYAYFLTISDFHAEINPDGAIADGSPLPRADIDLL